MTADGTAGSKILVSPIAVRPESLLINIRRLPRLSVREFRLGASTKARKPCAILARLPSWTLISWRRERNLETFTPKQTSQSRHWSSTSWH
jgi:hypothetical protein